MINYKKAKKILIKSKIKIESELVGSMNSLNRVCARNIYSSSNYPAGNNTAFDGYAIKSRDTLKLNRQRIQKFKILKTIAAGDNPKIKNVKNFTYFVDKKNIQSYINAIIIINRRLFPRK